MKTCKLCGAEKPEDAFFRAGKGNPRRGECKACTHERVRQAEARAREAILATVWTDDLRVDLAVVREAGPLAGCVRAMGDLPVAEIGRRCGVTPHAVRFALRRPLWPSERTENVRVDRHLLCEAGPWVALLEAVCQRALTGKWREYTQPQLEARLGWSQKTVMRYLAILEARRLIRVRRKRGDKPGGTREYKLTEVRL